MNKIEAITAELADALGTLKDAGFTEEQAKAIVTAMTFVVAACELDTEDDRLIDGDDQRDIRGY